MPVFARAFARCFCTVHQALATEGVDVFCRDLASVDVESRRQYQVQPECWKPKARCRLPKSSANLVDNSSWSLPEHVVTLFLEFARKVEPPRIRNLQHFVIFKASNNFKEAGAFGRCNFCRLDSAIDTDRHDTESKWHLQHLL